jgi:heparan-alpha-glucosaminide N-acetyltransferase
MKPGYRVSSIDIFRGLTMLLMIFVNDLASVHGLPWWNYHLPASANGMTYVDMVFPTFLFIVGLSLPLAVNRRIEKGNSLWQLWRHILARTAGLLALGIALANADSCTSMPPNLWGFLILVSGILFWLTDRRFRYVGLAGLLILFALFRRGNHWLTFGYWEILGIIGWTYLAVCLVYIPTRRWKFAPLCWLVVFCAYNCWSPIHLPMHLWPFSNGGFCLLVFAGMVATQILFTDAFRHKMTVGLIYAAVLCGAGMALLPFGISKIRATPTWCLFTASAAMLVLIGLHWLCDLKQKTGWAAFAKPAGSNTILTYLLPDLYYFGIGLSFVDHGLPGVFRAAVFTALMLALSALLTRWNIRMQL